METWSPNLKGHKGAIYIALADEIGRAIRDGRLAPAARLPTQRALARTTGLNLTTVNRGYAIAVQRGLVSAEVGRGTFVRTMRMPEMVHWPKGAGFSGIDLSTNMPGASATAHDLSQAISLLREDVAHDILGYWCAKGLPEHRAAAVDWLRQLGMLATPEQILTVSGAMHGMALSLMAICRPGDRVLVEELTSPGVIGLCNTLGLNVDSVPLDAKGITPEGLKLALDAGAAKAVILVPNLQNPTLAIMPPERRRDIAELLRRYRVFAVENDVYGPLLRDPPAPLATHAPAWVCYVTSLSKVGAPGIRVGWLAPPFSLLRRVTDLLQVTNGNTSPVLAHIASSWITSGVANRMAQLQRDEAGQRQSLARRILHRLPLTGHASALHVWLALPEPWRSEEFAAYAEAHGVAVMSSESFSISRSYHRKAIRISLCNCPMDHLEDGLKKLNAILQGRL